MNLFSNIALTHDVGLIVQLGIVKKFDSIVF